MNLFNLELVEPKKSMIDRAKENKDFRVKLGEIVDAYLSRRISFLSYIDKMYELHRKYKRKGFSKQDLINQRERFFKRKAAPLRVS